MNTHSEKKIIFFSCPLDCDEKADSIQEKLTLGPSVSDESDDPADPILDIIREEVPQELWSHIGSVPVPSWLRPKPSGHDMGRVVVDEFVTFIDQDGCKTAASQAGELVKTRILPDIPCMIAVDHSLTGGVFTALAKVYGKEDISLIVLDSHTDAIPMSALAGAIQYDMDTNPESVYDSDDPFLYNRPDSYNASSFIRHLLAREAVLPENLWLIGVSDYPGKRATRIKDPRIRDYVGVYTGLKRDGVKIITKKEYLMNPSKLKILLRRIQTKYVYISIDMDIGARSAVEGVRFRDWQGLNEKQILRIAGLLREMLSEEVQLVGMDITEINPRRAGQNFPSGTDRTYPIAANLIKKIGFGL